MAEAPDFPCESEDPESLQEEALLCVDQALLLEETNNADQVEFTDSLKISMSQSKLLSFFNLKALIMYQKALAKLDLALVKYENKDDGVPSKKKRLKMNNIRQQVLFRLEELKNSFDQKMEST
jgi:hypothetical protein